MSAVSRTWLGVWFHIIAFEAPVYIVTLSSRVFPGGSDSKEFAYNAGDRVSIPVLVGPPGEGNATHSCLLAWGIPWTEEPDSPRSGYNWVTELNWVNHIHTLCSKHQSKLHICVCVSESFSISGILICSLRMNLYCWWGNVDLEKLFEVKELVDLRPGTPTQF